MKKGFTLIELLAVIVILAIISLIAVPIVVNIINDSKTSSDEQTVELYLDTVKKTITKKQLSNSNFNPDKCKILSNGDLDCYNDNNKIETLKVDMKGEQPEKGIIELKDNKFIYKNILLNGKYYYERGILVNDADNNNEISIGDKYTYKVNDTDKFFFYVLSFNDDSTVNLIMDRNICEDGTTNYEQDPKSNYCRYAWHRDVEDNNYGPDTAMTILYNATKKWNNVPEMIMDYRDEENKNSDTIGYIGIQTENGVTTITGKQNKTSDEQIIGNSNNPLKSRLPKKSEVNRAGCTGSKGSCPVWLMEYIHYYDVTNNVGIDKYSMNNNKSNNNNGYWLLASHDDRIMFARAIRFYGNVHSYNFLQIRYTNQYGVRPVITVPITDLAN